MASIGKVFKYVSTAVGLVIAPSFTIGSLLGGKIGTAIANNIQTKRSKSQAIEIAYNSENINQVENLENDIYLPDSELKKLNLTVGEKVYQRDGNGNVKIKTIKNIDNSYDAILSYLNIYGYSDFSINGEYTGFTKEKIFRVVGDIVGTTEDSLDSLDNLLNGYVENGKLNRIEKEINGNMKTYYIPNYKVAIKNSDGSYSPSEENFDFTEDAINEIVNSNGSKILYIPDIKKNYIKNDNNEIVFADSSKIISNDESISISKPNRSTMIQIRDDIFQGENFMQKLLTQAHKYENILINDGITNQLINVPIKELKEYKGKYAFLTKSDYNLFNQTINQGIQEHNSLLTTQNNATAVNA